MRIFPAFWSVCLTLVMFAISLSAVRAEEIDLDYTRDTLTKEINAILQYNGIPSVSIALLKKDKLVWTEAFGYSNMKLQTPASPNTIYSTGSCFKPVTAMAVMQLADRGKLNLDDPIRDYLGENAIRELSPDTVPITFRHLLSHYSGLPATHEMVRITGVLPQSPASRAGLSAGLVIQTINGTSIQGKSVAECLGAMDGAVGTKIRLEFAELSQSEAKTVELTKQDILIPS